MSDKKLKPIYFQTPKIMTDHPKITGDHITLIAPVATCTANTTANFSVLAQLNSAAPSIKYKIAAGTLSLYVNGYVFDL